MFARSFLKPATIGLLLALGPSLEARADQDTAKESVVMWAAFKCSEYATWAEDPKEYARLMDVGFAYGQSFAEASQAGTISKEEVTAIVPAPIQLIVHGHSAEFILGRIYETALRVVRDEMFSDVTSLASLASTGKLPTLSRMAVIAEAKFQNANCTLVR